MLIDGLPPLVTDIDGRRLRNLLSTAIAQRTPVTASLLARKLDRARLVPATSMPATIATMNSRLACLNPEDSEERELSLVYPWASAPSFGRYSILSRVGVDLLGTMPGRRIMIDGKPWDVLYVAFQPEVERRFLL